MNENNELSQESAFPMESKYKSNHFTQASYYPWLVWGLAATFFFVEYIARVSPNVMVPDLMQAFGVNALELGGLSSAFYLAYVCMQLPVGALVDRYGPRLLLSGMALVCAVGCWLFSEAHGVTEAVVGRFLLGFASAFAFIGALKLSTVWFPPERIGLLAGMTQAIGMLGASVGEEPVAYTIELFGWRYTSFMMAELFVAMALLLVLLVRDRDGGKTHPDARILPQADEGIFSGLKNILSRKQCWINACFAGLLYGPTAILGELWGVTGLEHAHHISHEEAASAIGFLFIGWGVGGPLMGWFSDKIRQRKKMMMISAVMSLILIDIILFVPLLSAGLLSVLFFVYGVFNTGVALAYAVSTEISPRRAVGASLAFANMCSIMVGAVCLPLFGFIMDWHSSGLMENGIPVYTAADFQAAFLIIPILLVLAVLLSFRLKETHCQILQE